MLRSALVFAAALASGGAGTEMHEVKMPKRYATGVMVFEPDSGRAAPGDMVRFVAADEGHDAATINGFLSAGAILFKARSARTSRSG